ncbi:MAG: HAD hydrolase family protein [Phycisphaeraceae bacterium]|nr:MAG: HAD hydrolase family protein [Phycisphaeraceae bacterium]
MPLASNQAPAREAAAGLAYDLLALDLDGTLLAPDGTISARNKRAIERAREAGLRVTICTGRGFVECERFLREIGQLDPVIVAGGSILSCPQTRRTIHRFAIDQNVVARAVDRLLGHGHAVLVLKDPIEAGYDYLVVRGHQNHPIDPVTDWWFREMNVKARFAASLTDDEHPEHTVRFGICGLDSTLDPITADLVGHLGDDIHLHNFPAVVAPEHTRLTGEGRRYHILEVFSKHANKWTSLSWLASMHGVATSRVVAIGDEVNDEAMITGAGLGIAMGNAVPRVKAAAKRHTLRHDEDGVAHAIERVLGGEW